MCTAGKSNEDRVQQLSNDVFRSIRAENVPQTSSVITHIQTKGIRRNIVATICSLLLFYRWLVLF